MLKTLTVNNFALIDHVQIAFAPGLNILTGETGAGKSILIDALGAILGERASVESIRSGCDYFRVEAVFDITDQQSLFDRLDDLGISCEEDTLIISRRLTRSGKNTVTVNGCQTPLAVLRQIGEWLIDMHGQHENQALLRPQSHLTLVDAYREHIEPILADYRSTYLRWQQIRNQLDDHETRSRERERQIEMLAWQIEEIEQAQLRPGEDEQGQQEIRRLANVEKIAHAVARSYFLLQEGERGSAVLTVLGEIRRDLETVIRYDETLRPQCDVLTDCLYQLDDIASELRQYTEKLDSDPDRLQKLQDRQAAIQQLKKKYGSDIEDILAYQHHASSELAALQQAGQTVEQLIAKEQELEDKLFKLSNYLDQERRQAAAELETAVTAHLKDLGMPSAIFRVIIGATEQFQPTGRNEVFCVFSANRGEEPKPLQKVASGGELSRIALAIKSVCADKNSVGTVIFDEVDAGIGGKTAQMVAEKIAFVASSKQVLCITHSPAIASMADIHWLTEKVIDSDRTVTLVRQLAPPERILELARMVAGDQTTQITVENARQMIEIARKKKDKWRN